MTLDELNAADPDRFVAALDGVFEHAPWVARRAAAHRPFASVPALHEALMAAVRAAPADEILAFLNGHPELAAARLAADLTPESRAEQEALGMAGTADAAALAGLNAAYRERFGFPFIICAARHTPANVVRRLRARLEREPGLERDAALDEVGHITALRLAAKLGRPQHPPIDGLSCHALDVSAGRPAEGLRVTVLQEGRVLGESVTDADGRIAAGLLPPGPLRQGQYGLDFHAGAYFAARSTPTFYDVIPVRFVIADTEAHYHIPLLLAPFAYSTYRGS